MTTTTGATAVQVALQVFTDTYAVLAIPSKGAPVALYEGLTRDEARVKWTNLVPGLGVRKYVIQKEGLPGLTFSIKDAWMGSNPVLEAEKILLTVNTERSQSHSAILAEKQYNRDLRWIDREFKAGRLMFDWFESPRKKGVVKAHNKAQNKRWAKAKFIRDEVFHVTHHTGGGLNAFRPIRDGVTLPTHFLKCSAVDEADLDFSEEEEFFEKAQVEGCAAIGTKAWNIAFRKPKVSGRQTKRARQKLHRGEKAKFRRLTTPKHIVKAPAVAQCQGMTLKGHRCKREIAYTERYCIGHTPAKAERNTRMASEFRVIGNMVIKDHKPHMVSFAYHNSVGKKKFYTVDISIGQASTGFLWKFGAKARKDRK